MRIHLEACAFGSGFYRVYLRDGSLRYCDTADELRAIHGMLPPNSITRVTRDGYCLDGLRGDANTPDVVDAEHWLGMTVAEGMRELGLPDEATYARVYRDIEAAVSRRNNRESQTGVHASIVIKRPGARVADG